MEESTKMLIVLLLVTSVATAGAVVMAASDVLAKSKKDFGQCNKDFNKAHPELNGTAKSDARKIACNSLKPGSSFTLSNGTKLPR